MLFRSGTVDLQLHAGIAGIKTTGIGGFEWTAVQKICRPIRSLLLLLVFTKETPTAAEGTSSLIYRHGGQTLGQVCVPHYIFGGCLIENFCTEDQWQCLMPVIKNKDLYTCSCRPELNEYAPKMPTWLDSQRKSNVLGSLCNTICGHLGSIPRLLGVCAYVTCMYHIRTYIPNVAIKPLFPSCLRHSPTTTGTYTCILK